MPRISLSASVADAFFHLAINVLACSPIQLSSLMHRTNLSERISLKVNLIPYSWYSLCRIYFVPIGHSYVMVILLLSVRRTKLNYPSRNLSPAQAVKVNMWWQLENLGQSPGVERSPNRANKANKGNLKSPLISSREGK